MTEDRAAIEDKLAELIVQHAGLQELISTLKDGKGATKVVEWHSKMEGLRLEELKKTRHIQRLAEQVNLRVDYCKHRNFSVSFCSNYQYF